MGKRTSRESRSLNNAMRFLFVVLLNIMFCFKCLILFNVDFCKIVLILLVIDVCIESLVCCFNILGNVSTVFFN